jgi:hypothetical protein
MPFIIRGPLTQSSPSSPGDIASPVLGFTILATTPEASLPVVPARLASSGPTTRITPADDSVKPYPYTNMVVFILKDFTFTYTNKFLYNLKSTILINK